MQGIFYITVKGFSVGQVVPLVSHWLIGSTNSSHSGQVIEIVSFPLCFAEMAFYSGNVIKSKQVWLISVKYSVVQGHWRTDFLGQINRRRDTRQRLITFTVG